MARDLIDNGGNGRKIELDVRRRVDLEGAELDEYMRSEGEKQKQSKLLVKQQVLEESSSDSDDDLEMNVITGKHDIVVRPEGRAHTGFFKSSRKQYVMFPFHEEKIRTDEYGEIIQLDDYRMLDQGPDYGYDDYGHHKDHHHQQQQNQIKAEDLKKELADTADEMMVDKPSKCINSRKLIEINAQVQFIDFEGTSDGESLLKILSQLRPRRVIVVRGSPENVDVVAKHCAQNIGARVFTPNKGDVVDATTETHIYQVRLTEALISQLLFQKGKDAEVAWIDAQMVVRSKLIEATADELMDVDPIEKAIDDGRFD